VQGESAGFTLFGFIGVIHPTYGQALARLHGGVTGDLAEKGYELKNVQRESTKSNYLLYSIPRKTITAELVPRK